MSYLFRGLTADVVDHVAVIGSGYRARGCVRRWVVSEPGLAGFASPAEVAAACRAAGPVDQDRLLAAVLRVAAGDEWAQLTVLAGVAGRLGWVVSGWVRAGVAAGELADAEARLVAGCWAAIAGCAGRPPDRPGLVLVDRAWETVRADRHRELRYQAAMVPLTGDLPAATVVADRPVLDVLAGVVCDAVTNGRLGLRPARAVYLTRVTGLSTVEAGRLLGCGDGVVRVVRSRAERHLAA